jgi:CubicO group peptidase (beta-lactamase class C family)
VARTGLGALGVAVLLAGCAGGAADEPAAAPTTTAPAPVFPGSTWPTATPEAQGLSHADLAALDEFLGARGTHCVAVVRNGYLVHSRYWNGYDARTEQEVFSVSKSVTATLVGIAQDLGRLDVDQPASDFLTEWRGTASEEVTIRNLLANDSGRHYDFTTDYEVMALGVEDKSAFAIGLDQQHEAGTWWAYNNSAIQTLEEVLERATGQDVAQFAEQHLFGPLGMTSWIRRDGAGNPLTFMGTQASCPDLARFGWMALNEGRWGDDQVVSADWMREATNPSQELNTIYGLLWWVNGDGRRQEDAADETPTFIDDGSLWWPDAPEDAFAALGLGGQDVLVVPSEGLVITRLADGSAEADPNDIIRLALGG